MSDTWPDANAVYQRPADTPEHAVRWQSALDQALEGGSLKLSVEWVNHIYLLSGACPRCGHTTSQEVHSVVLHGFKEPKLLDSTFNFDCECGVHAITSDGKTSQSGCGWGGPLTATLTAARFAEANKAYKQSGSP